MKCRAVQRKLSAYQDKELKSEEYEQVKKHLLSCQSCREQYQNFERVWQTLGGLGEIQPDPWFYGQLVTKIKEPCEQGWLPTLRQVFQPLRAPVMISIILIVGLLAGSYLGRILARFDLLPFQTHLAGYSHEAFFASMKVFE